MTRLSSYLDGTIAVLRALQTDDMEARLDAAVDLVAGAVAVRAPVLVCGNGGSSADAMHIAGELVDRFRFARPAFNVIALGTDLAVLSAWSNDYEFETAYARQVEAHGRPDGVLIALSTSGNSKNILAALRAAKDIGMACIGLTGQGGGAVATLCDVLLDVPSRDTPHTQEAHVCLYHQLCERVERRAAGRDDAPAP